ncbi:unnamed protein product [Colias eurytheme]|nr:unnamed protein product [Colias eurytheme]
MHRLLRKPRRGRRESLRKKLRPRISSVRTCYSRAICPLAKCVRNTPVIVIWFCVPIGFLLSAIEKGVCWHPQSAVMRRARSHATYACRPRTR